MADWYAPYQELLPDRAYMDPRAIASKLVFSPEVPDHQVCDAKSASEGRDRVILEHGKPPNALADMAAQLGGSATGLYSGPKVAQIALPDQFLAAEIKMRLP